MAFSWLSCPSTMAVTNNPSPAPKGIVALSSMSEDPRMKKSRMDDRSASLSPTFTSMSRSSVPKLFPVTVIRSPALPTAAETRPVRTGVMYRNLARPVEPDTCSLTPMSMLKSFPVPAIRLHLISVCAVVTLGLVQGISAWPFLMVTVGMSAATAPSTVAGPKSVPVMTTSPPSVVRGTAEITLGGW